LTLILSPVLVVVLAMRLTTVALDGTSFWYG
jgi:hypothetical protein